MKMRPINWSYSVAALVCAAPVFAGHSQTIYLDSTNRVSLSMRLGFNIKGGFRGVGSTFAPGSPFSNAQTTPGGAAYNYTDGYVYPGSSTGKNGYTTYWGYNSASQVDTAKNTINFTQTTTSGAPMNDGGSFDAGMEFAFDHELVKTDAGNFSWGFETAVNWLPVSFSGNYNLSLVQTTTAYGYTAGTVPPGYSAPNELPYQGSYNGPGFSLSYPSAGSSSAVLGSATLHVHQDFNANLWGLRFGPYIDIMPSTHWDVHLTAGAAAGVLAGSASWQETLVVNGSPTTQQGSGNDVSALGGVYAAVGVSYNIDSHWSASVEGQFQDLGNYSHNYGGRGVALSLDQTAFLTFGINYSF